ncbi:hypothetical protein F0919_17910 [Taibaiella lutea]|uniref:Uncharacterized protein n=1 Tax=Taibaiella lutea TaxID=2608001 RepID=A0A5M6CC01_9BACT|nr:hypothetical protein [Taibaiella lutea]KAA5532657.1 hypothetical protein F0919_17910 [Taibaiella lutea]
MPITSFQSNVRPTASSLNAAYRPIIFQPKFDSTLIGTFPPVVYCDIYFNGTYYKTQTSTTYYQINAFNAPYWIFDIQTVVQEYLKSNLPLLNLLSIAPTTTDFIGVNGSSSACYCKFRVSSTDSNGFIVPEGSPGSGGYASPTFYVLNSVLQHEDNQDLKTHLNFYKVPLGFPPAAGYEFMPLSHRPNGYIISKYDYDSFPLFSIKLPSGESNYSLAISYKRDGDMSFTNAYTQYVYSGQNNIAISIPTGIIQLKPLTWYSNLLPITPTTVPFDDITEYTLSLVYDLSIVPPSVLNASFKTPLFKTYGCNCNKQRLHVRFLNYLGFYDAVNFSEINGSIITTSDEWQKALKFPLVKSDGGAKKLTVISNEQFTVSTCEYGEDMQQWLKELFDSPEVYIEWPGGQGQDAANIPILVKDGEFVLRKSQDRYEYVTQIQFTMSNENIRQRN